MPPSEVKPCTVGIDVSKDTLDIFLLPQRKHWRMGNELFSLVCKRLKLHEPELIILEPTGGYEIPLYKALVAAGFRVCREDARKLYHHRKSQGKWGKTDMSDAESMAHYAQCYCREITQGTVVEEVQEELRQIMGRRADLVKMQTMEKNRAQMPGLESGLKSSCLRMLKWLDKEIQQLNETIQSKIEAQPVWRKRHRLLQSVQGISEISANALLAYLPELGNLSSKQIAALVGVAPYPNQSGKYQGKSHVRGGRQPVRNHLFMAILSAIVCNPVIRDFYKHLLKKGKPKKVALVACMHKLLRILNAMLKQGKPFQLKPA